MLMIYLLSRLCDGMWLVAALYLSAFEGSYIVPLLFKITPAQL